MSIIRPIQYPIDPLDRLINDGVMPPPILDKYFARTRNLVTTDGIPIAYTRGSADTEFDHNLNLRELGNNVASFTHDPVTGVSYGLQVPRSTVNEARNNRAAGATNGVIGSGGVAPTDWNLSAGSTGLSREVVGTGTEDGLPYCDVRFFGTASADICDIWQMTTTDAAALQDEVWTHSSYSRLVGGDLTNVSNTQVQVQERDGAGALLTSSGTNFTPTSAALKTQRRSHTRTLSNANTAFAFQRITFTIGNGAVDFTIRLAGTQLEEAPFATPLVLTDAGGSSTRSTFTNSAALPSVISGNPFIWLVKGRTAPGSGAGQQVIGIIDDGTGNERALIHRDGVTNLIRIVVTVGGSNVANFTLGSVADDTDIAVAYRVEENNFFAALNVGGTITTGSNSAGALPVGLDTKRYGRNLTGFPWESTIYRDTMWAGGGSDEFVRQLARAA